MPLLVFDVVIFRSCGTNIFKISELRSNLKSEKKSSVESTKELSFNSCIIVERLLSKMAANMTAETKKHA